MSSLRDCQSTYRVTAVLGPTNTGKTHLAVERMLAHDSGMIGLPLRLLAREIFDKVVQEKGSHAVALITGEEKISPKHPRYYVCTVESMPLATPVAFLAVDEVQLAADRERGHVFTDRLLHARGREETMFLGAETVRPLIQKLINDVHFITRPRFSTLRYSGARKLARLPHRSAIVAFSAAEVYTLAELMRRQRGGVAVVLGALSPRTRNAQVALYQSGDVDYLVATDAIGMGLNMSLDHVAFAGLRKFDGIGLRPLVPAEIGQVAGRAGRHMNDGTFGVTANVPELAEDVIENLESHRYKPLKFLQWRNSALSFDSVPGLFHALQTAPPRDELVRTRYAEDFLALQALTKDTSIAPLVGGPAAVRLLWDVCQTPDFRKATPDAHHRLLSRIYGHLMQADGRLPEDWLSRQVEPLNRVDGDIDTLSGRIAHVRTWTYIANRPDWTPDPAYWRGRTREIEDQLSDALHTALTQRFVDRKTSALIRGLSGRTKLVGSVNSDGEVLVEGQFVGRLRGLVFEPDPDRIGFDRRTLLAAANRVLRDEIEKQATILLNTTPDMLQWPDTASIKWRNATIGTLSKGAGPMTPLPRVIATEHLAPALMQRIVRHLQAWLDQEIRRTLAPLFRLLAMNFEGTARGLVFLLGQGMGFVSRAEAADLLHTIPPADRRRLRHAGVVLGYHDIFMPALLRPKPARLRYRLTALFQECDFPPLPPEGRVSFIPQEDYSDAALFAAGYRRCGILAVRLDILERLSPILLDKTKQQCQAGHEILSLLGTAAHNVEGVFELFGYRLKTIDGVATYVRSQQTGTTRAKRRKTSGKTAAPPQTPDRKKPNGKSAPRRKTKQPAIDPNHAFAALHKLKQQVR